jgi:hypothetical protein
MREHVERGLEVLRVGGDHEIEGGLMELDNVDISKVITSQRPGIPGIFEPKTGGNHLEVGHDSTHPSPRSPEAFGWTNERPGLAPTIRARHVGPGQVERSYETSPCGHKGQLSTLPRDEHEGSLAASKR